MATSRTLELLITLRDEASAKLQSGISGQLQKLKPQLKEVAEVSGATFGALTAAIGLSAKQFGNAGDALEKMSMRTGLSVESLSRLQYAADLSGTSLEGVEAAVKRMSTVLSKADDDSKQAAAAMQNLGVNIDDVFNMNPEQRFITLAERVAAIEDPTRRSAAAVQIFGREGTMLLPLLEKGADGLRQLMSEADSVAYVFDSNTAHAANQLNDDFTRLGYATKSVSLSLGAAFAPALDKAATAMLPVINGIARFVQQHPGLVAGALAAATAIAGITFALTGLGLILPSLTAGVAFFGVTLSAAIWPVTAFAVAVGALAAVLVSMESASSGANAGIQDFLGKSGDIPGSMSEAATHVGRLGGSFENLGKQVQQAAKEVADLEKQISRTLRDEADNQKDYQQDLAQAVIDQENKIKDMTKEVEEKKADIVQMNREKVTAENWAEHKERVDKANADLKLLEDQLSKEQTALAMNRWIERDNIDAMTEMRRRANQTEFENKIESIMRQRVAELTHLADKLSDMEQELAAKKAQLAELSASEEGYTEKVRAEEGKRLSIVQSTTAAIQASYLSRTSSTPVIGANLNNALSTSPAKGLGSFTVHDAIITPRGDIITTDPADYLIATKTPGALGSNAGGVTVNVYGDVSGMELVDKVKQALMSQLRMNYRFAV